ncbi:hydroxyacid dehydrogenase [Cryomorphaceae bacterium]|nr:hydroxyacid dehydrogenase [Cryomorphaceae bacterium]
MAGRVLLIDHNHDALVAGLNQLGYTCEPGYELSYQEVLDRVPEYDGLVIRSRITIDQKLLEAATQLRWIGRVGAGMENIDVSFAESQGVACLNAPEGNRNAVAEHALGMLLSLFNNLRKADAEVRHGLWKREANRGLELAGKTVGIIGYGYMGSWFAQRLASLGVEVLAHDKYKTHFVPQEHGAHIRESSLEQLQEEADIISLHLPQSEETHHYIDDTFIEKCARPFFLVNTARGKNVDTAALIGGLRSGKVLGACLDVLEYESSSFSNLFDRASVPKDLQELLEDDRVILSPHVAGWTHESHRRLAEVIVEKVAALGH